MGLDNYIVNRIFNLIDEDNDGKVNFENFLKYLSIIINGSTLEKALWSFKLLSNKKAYISRADIEKLVYDVS